MGGRESDAALDATSARKEGRAARYRRYERTRRRVRAKTSQGAIASTYPTRTPHVPHACPGLRNYCGADCGSGYSLVRLPACLLARR